MDPRQQSHEYGEGSAQRTGGNYAFNGTQNDVFNTFVHTDNESAFDSSWNSQAFPAQQQPINGFDQGHQAWQQNAYQNSNLLPINNFGAQSRDYDQTFSRTPAPFNYAGFDSNANPTFSPPAYANTLNYGQLPLNNGTPYGYTGNQGFQEHNETISPQALQHYPFPVTAADEGHQSQKSHYESNLSARGVSAAAIAPSSNQEWSRLSSVTPQSTIFLKGLHIKPTASLSSATRSTKLDGFTFVGNGTLPRSIPKDSLSRFKRRRSLKEIRRLLEVEKGNDPWHRDREPVLKRLKLTESKHSGPRAASASTHPRTGSVAESASPSESSESESEDDSEYSSDSDREPEPEELSPLPAARPADPSKAVQYDVIKAVWAKKSVGLSGTVIRAALADYWNIFKGIRDKWKSKSTLLQQSIEKKDTANIKAYERRIVEQRRLLESCISLTLKHGHPDIIEKLGENPGFLLIFYQFLADRFKDSEYTGSLIAGILELMTRCITIDQSVLEKTKMDKVLPRLVKRGDDMGKNFAQKILDNASEVTKQKATDGRFAQGQQSNGTSAKSSNEKARPPDSNESKSIKASDAKRTSSATGNKGATTSKPSSNSDDLQPSGKGEASVGTKSSSADGSNTKVKANHIIAKPSGFFSSLKSASKKPGTSSQLKDGKVNVGPVSKAETASEPPKPAFSFAATMANLTKQAEAPPVKSEETRKPETPEERRKRLRKEERRKLKVSWKEDDLVQIREFVHDPEEELGHEDSQVRDVGDSRGEGQMLKMHKDLEVMDEDEDYEPPEELLPNWVAPRETDFSVIDADELARNYTSRGGNVEIKSDERAAQEKRELDNLMVIYTTYSDIPPSPREPSEPYSGESTIEQIFGTPIEETKKREAQYYAGQHHQPATSPAQPEKPNISALLRILSSQQQIPAPQPQPQPAVPAPSTGLEAIFAQFANSNEQQQAPRMHVPQPAQPAPQFNLQAALAGMQPSQANMGYGTAQPAPVANLQAILAGLGSQPAPQAPQMQGYGYPNQYQNEHDRKRQYEQDEHDYGYGKVKRSRGSDGQVKKPFVGPPRLPCKFFQEGKCRKGDACTFLHDT